MNTNIISNSTNVSNNIALLNNNNTSNDSVGGSGGRGSGHTSHSGLPDSNDHIGVSKKVVPVTAGTTTTSKFKQSIFSNKKAQETLGEIHGGDDVTSKQIIANSYSSSSSSSGYMSKSSGSSLTSGSLVTSPIAGNNQSSKNSDGELRSTQKEDPYAAGSFIKRTLSNSMLDVVATKESFTARNEIANANMMYRAGSDCSIYNPTNSNSTNKMVTFQTRTYILIKNIKYKL